MRDSELRIVSLISGGGSTMEAILKSTLEGELQGKIRMVAVIADRVTSGISKGTQRGIQGYIIERKRFESSEQWGEIVIRACKDAGADMLLLNGLLSLVPANVIEEYNGRIFNQHPAPLDPEHKNSMGEALHFGGKGMHGDAAHASVLIFQENTGRSFPTEATIHRVTLNFDEGGVVMRKPVEVYKDDTPETLAKRVLPNEHAAQIEFLGNLYNGKVETLKREEPLIRSEEEEILYEAKNTAIEKYRKR